MDYWVYVGTNTTNGRSKGIYRLTFDAASGRAGAVELAAETANPTWVSPDPSLRYLYAVNAVGEFRGERTGSVSAFRMDRKSGALALLNQEASGGPGPCHLTIDARTRNLLVANYVGGSVACLPIRPDGSLGAPASRVQHQGSGPNARRQEGPHAHSINLDASGRFAFAADLGLDRIFVYRLDGERGTLTANDPPHASTAPGAGPRHFALHPSGKFAYAINELNSTITAFRVDGSKGSLAPFQVIATIPEGFQAENYTAEVQVHRSGRLVFGSNRGHDSIAVFRVDSETGTLTAVGRQPSGGKWPRNFGQDPSGTWMLVGNQDSDNILVFRIDVEKGTLTHTGQTLGCPVPICFKFVPRA